MRLTSTVARVLFLALAVVGACDERAGDDDAKDAKAVAPPPAVAAPTNAEADAPGAPQIGIPECDEFIAKFARCIEEKVPAGGRAQAQTAMEAMVKGFKDTAAGSGRDQLPATCKSTMDTTKQSMTAMGCTW